MDTLVSSLFNLRELNKLLVWKKAYVIGDGSIWHPNEWRQDIYGRTIYFHAYGNRQSCFGWEIDHIWPKSLGGTDEMNNLRPLNYLSNVKKGNKLPSLGELIANL